jgi:Sulfotransferase family
MKEKNANNKKKELNKNNPSQVSVLHIGKTAGTALFTALKEHNEKSEKKLMLHGHSYSLKMLWKKAPKRNVVFGVREPISRYISAFNSRLREGLPRHHTPWSNAERVAFSMFKTPNELAEALSAGDATRKAAAELSMWAIKHVNKPLAAYLGGVEYLKKHNDKIKFVYLTETFDKDFEVMRDILKLGDVLLPTDEVSAHRMPSEMSTALSEAARDNLRRWYEQDLQVYEYCKGIHQKMVENRTAEPDAEAA